MAGRVSQVGIEPLAVSVPNVRISQEAVEPLVVATSEVRVSQAVVEPLIVAGATARVSQVVVEPLAAARARARISQIVVECLVPNLELLVPIVFPTLAGLGFSVHWKPQFANVPSAKPSAGGAIDLSLSDIPTHQFELTFHFLRDGIGWQGADLKRTVEWRTLGGFVLQMKGTVGRCLFKWKDDCGVKSQPLGTTDGTTRIFTLQRTFGAGGYGGTEPIGWLDQTEPFTVYLDGVWQDPSSYVLLTDVGGQQQVDFNAAPAAGQGVTCDMSYFYYCRLIENAQDFEKFMNRLWKVGKLTLESCLAGQ